LPLVLRDREAITGIGNGELSLGRIRRLARAMKKRATFDLVVMDYDELIEAPGETEFDQQRALARAGRSRWRLNSHAPVILVSQLRKPLSGEDAKRPTLQRLYGSAAKVKPRSSSMWIVNLSGNSRATKPPRRFSS
jgi:replicative DNA helicase